MPAPQLAAPPFFTAAAAGFFFASVVVVVVDVVVEVLAGVAVDPAAALVAGEAAAGVVVVVDEVVVDVVDAGGESFAAAQLASPGLWSFEAPQWPSAGFASLLVEVSVPLTGAFAGLSPPQAAITTLVPRTARAPAIFSTDRFGFIR